MGKHQQQTLEALEALELPLLFLAYPLFILAVEVAALASLTVVEQVEPAAVEMDRVRQQVRQEPLTPAVVVAVEGNPCHLIQIN
jgi:hypothetical protein